MTERFTVSMSDEGFEEMEADRDDRGLSRSAYVEQAVRKSINRNTKFEVLVDALTTGVAISFVLMVLSGLWMLGTYWAARTVMSGDFVAAAGLFGASALMVLGLPYAVEYLEARQTTRQAEKVEQ
jgi:hypothetical protein